MHPNDSRQLVVPGGLYVAQYKALDRSKECFDEEGAKVFISKNYWSKYLARNLLPARPAKRLSKSC